MTSCFHYRFPLSQTNRIENCNNHRSIVLGFRVYVIYLIINEHQAEMEPPNRRKISFASISFALGVWAFIKVNAVSGPVFEPIIASCSNPDISADEFASKTGYHEYEPKVGLGVFNILVCLITQFLLELRETHPAGVLVWGGVLMVSLPAALFAIFQPGRAGARGPIRYPTIIGLLYQLFGISIIFPLLWVPSYIWGGGKQGTPLTMYRINMAVPMCVPGVILTCIIFTAPTDSYLWTISAGTLGGPLLILPNLLMWTDGSSSLHPTAKNMKRSIDGVKNVCNITACVCFLGWAYLVKVAYEAYGTDLGAIWNDIWVDAGGSVAFMTVDTGVLHLALLLVIAYHSEVKAIKALVLTPLIGPAAVCLAFKEIEIDAVADYLKEIEGEKKKV